MPVDDIYWNSIDFGSEDESVHDVPMKHYVDPWDLENYAYIREHLDSVDISSHPSSSDEFATEANSTSFSYIPIQREQNYAAIDEVRAYYNRPTPRRMYSDKGVYRNGPDNDLYRDGLDSEFDENPYEENLKDISLPYAHDHKDRWRRVPGPPGRNPRDRSISFSYGDYGTNQDIYCKLDDIRPKRDSTLPIYDDIRNGRRKPRNFGLSNYGHLKIDYSYSWNNLDKYIHH